MRFRFNKLTSNPKKIFLLDTVGAFLTAAFLFVIATKFSVYAGIPKILLYSLSGLAGLLGMYSLRCRFRGLSDWRHYLRIVAILNAGYCLLMIILIFIYYQEMTILALMYFLLELIVILSLILMEVATLIKPAKDKR